MLSVRLQSHPGEGADDEATTRRPRGEGAYLHHRVQVAHVPFALAEVAVRRHHKVADLRLLLDDPRGQQPARTMRARGTAVGTAIAC